MQTTGQIQFSNSSTLNSPGNWEVLNKQREAEDRRNEEREEDLDTSQENQQKLDKLVESTNQFCYSIRTHNPVDLFPDDLIVDIHKVTFIDNRLLSKNTISMPIKDINKVEVTNDILFASIELVNGSQTITITVNWLNKSDARQAQAIIQGLMIAYKNDLNLEEFSSEEIFTKVIALGTPVV